MSNQTIKELFVEAMLVSLDETFYNVRGMYLNRGTSLFETLATLSAEDASRPVSDTCATIAAHVEHMRFYMEVTLQFVRGERPQVDWQEIWRTVREVSPEEWAASQTRLRETVEQIRALVNSSTWERKDEIGGALALLMHNAYHVGQIHEALCTLPANR